jgi:hypothetical protein
MTTEFRTDPDAHPAEAFAEVRVDGLERGFIANQREWTDGRRTGRGEGVRTILSDGPDGRLLPVCPNVLCGSRRQAERAMLRMLSGEWR